MISWLLPILAASIPAAISFKLYVDYKQWLLPLVCVAILLFGLVQPIATNSKKASWEHRLIGIVALVACVLILQATYHYMRPSPPKDPITEKAFLLIEKNKPHEFYDFLLESEKGAEKINLTITNKEGWSMLHVLVSLSVDNPTWANNLDKVLSLCLPVNLLGPGCYTPLHLASQLGSREICEKLLKSGANPYLLTEIGHRPCDVAGLQGHLELAEWLEQQLHLPRRGEEAETVLLDIEKMH